MKYALRIVSVSAALLAGAASFASAQDCGGKKGFDPSRIDLEAPREDCGDCAGQTAKKGADCGDCAGQTAKKGADCGDCAGQTAKKGA
ncbi:MAG: hypothetical protein D6731_00455, partial [Planctomycetota bacterium]